LVNDNIPSKGNAVVAEQFTVAAWDAVRDWRDAIETMPFITALAEGSLPADAFAFYLAQDAVYLADFARALAAVAASAPDPAAQAFYAGSAHVALEVESGLHHAWLAEHDRPLAPEASPVTVAYTDHLLSAYVRGGYPVAVAAVLPCYWLYAHIAEVLVRRAGDLTGHPYQRWLSTYADPEFQESAARARQFTDEAAATVGAGVRERMLAAFINSSRHEYLFFAQGIDQPAWPAPPAGGY
jgi:hydroxymethylpyrimidine/phosphomethylpyrimidine kinase